jgi:hypothetical protein
MAGGSTARGGSTQQEWSGSPRRPNAFGGLLLPRPARAAGGRAGRGPGRCTIKVPAGANMTFPGGAEREVNGRRQRVMAAGACVWVPVGSAITVSGEQIALASAATSSTVAPGSTIAVSKDLTVMAAGLPGPGGTGPGASRGRVVEGGAAAGQTPMIAAAGAAVTVSGVADIELLRDTVLTAPDNARARLREGARLKMSARGRAIAADMRSVIPAAAVMMFGIGAELGMVRRTRRRSHCRGLLGQGHYGRRGGSDGRGHALVCRCGHPRARGFHCRAAARQRGILLHPVSG